MKHQIFLAGVAILAITGSAQAFERVGQKEFDNFASCFAQQLGVADLLNQHADDWVDVFGDNVEMARDSINVIIEIAADVSALNTYLAELLSELSHPAYGLDADQAEAAFHAEVADYHAVMALPRDTRMAILESEAFVVEMSDFCATLGEFIEYAVIANIESGAVVWDD